MSSTITREEIQTKRANGDHFVLAKADWKAAGLPFERSVPEEVTL